MSGREVSLFFQSERNDLQGTGIRMSSPQAVSSTGERHKPGPADLLKTISIGFIAGGLKNKTTAGLGRNLLLRYRLSKNSRDP